MKAFANYIRKLRGEAGLTQEEVAERLEVSKVTVQNWEKGKGIRRERLKEISTLFNAPIDDLKEAMDADINGGEVDNWPDFLFDRQWEDEDGNIINLDSDSNNRIVSELHLNLRQQELFGILCIYGAEYLQNDIVLSDDKENFHSCLNDVPFEYINKVGSIQFMNICDGLYKVIRYVKPDFLLKILKMDPEWQFNLRKLGKEQICEFIDGGYKRMDIDAEFDEEDDGLDFQISMNKAKVILPLLEQHAFYFKGRRGDAELVEDTPDNVVKAIASVCNLDYKSWLDGLPEKNGFCAAVIRSNLELVTEWNKDVDGEEQEVRWLAINDTGVKLLNWFREK